MGYNAPMRIALLAPFGLQPKGTVQARILPLAHALGMRATKCAWLFRRGMTRTLA